MSAEGQRGCILEFLASGTLLYVVTFEQVDGSWMGARGGRRQAAGRKREESNTGYSMMILEMDVVSCGCTKQHGHIHTEVRDKSLTAEISVEML